MNEAYKTIYSYGEDEFIVKKSRFIGYAKPVKTEEEALEFIEEIKTKHYDATHNCYAYIIGEDAMIQRFSDDGEPSGTAGIPMLEVLKKEEIVNIVAVATRYYGGIQLGAGGLIRAYTKSAKIGIDAGKIIDMEMHKNLEFELEYDQYGRIENYLLSNGYHVEDTGYGELVKINLYVKNSQVKGFIKDITNMTSGDAVIEDLGEKHIPIYKGKRIV